MSELLSKTSCRKDYKRISSESSLLSPRRPNRSRDLNDWTHWAVPDKIISAQSSGRRGLRSPRLRSTTLCTLWTTGVQLLSVPLVVTLGTNFSTLWPMLSWFLWTVLVLKTFLWNVQFHPSMNLFSCVLFYWTKCASETYFVFAFLMAFGVVVVRVMVVVVVVVTVAAAAAAAAAITTMIVVAVIEQ